MEAGEQMKYLNQLDMEDIPYPTNTLDPTSDFYTKGTIKIAGCGICCACMLVDRLSNESPDVIEVRDLAMACNANWEPGTDMEVFAPVLAERFGLDYLPSDSGQELVALLQNGGAAILNTGGNRDGYESLFYDGGHYIVAIGYQDGFVRILDPAYFEGKFEGAAREAGVRDQGGVIYASLEVLQKETDNRSPRYYLFNDRIGSA